MRVLFFLEPWVDHGWPSWRDSWIEAPLHPLHECIKQFQNYEGFFLAGDAQKPTLERLITEPRTRTAIITQKELRTVFPDYLAAALAWYDDCATPQETGLMQAIVRQKLGSFTPDIIITVFTSVPFLRALFPNAMILHEDNACFAQEPFPHTITLDPCGMLKNGFIGKEAQSIIAEPLSEEAHRFLDAFRQKYLDQHLIAQNPFTRADLVGDRQFRHLVLLPLHVTGAFSFNGNAPFRSQWDMIGHVFDHIRPDIGVVVTQHTAFEKPITPDVHDYLTRTYPNYIHLDSFQHYQSVSQYLLHHVDAVAAVSSSLCFQTLLWRKHLCAIGQSHVNAFADSHAIEDLGDHLDSGGVPNKDALLYFLLTCFNIPVSETYLWNRIWLEKRLSAWLAYYRDHGCGRDFFHPIDDPDKLLAFYLQRSN